MLKYNVFQTANIPGSKTFREQTFHGVKVAWNYSMEWKCMELSLPGVKLSLPGAKVLRSEKAIIPVHNVNNLIYNSLNEIYNK